MQITLDAGITAASILIATFVAWYQLRRQAKADAVQHTVGLLSHMFDENQFSQARAALVRIKRSGRTLADDEVTDDEDAAIIPTLNYYDFLSCLLNDGEINPKIVTITLGGAIHADLEYLRPYVIARRKRLGRPALYENIFEADRRWYQYAE